MRHEPKRGGIRQSDAIACQGEIHAGSPGKPRKGIDPADIREEADADLGHREQVAPAAGPIATVERHADAAAHHDPVDQRDIRLRVAMDQRIELVFLTPEGQRLVALSRQAEIVEAADVAAGAEGLLAGSRDHHPRAGRIPAQASSARRMARTIPSVRAFRAFGRFMVMIPAAPASRRSPRRPPSPCSRQR